MRLTDNDLRNPTDAELINAAAKHGISSWGKKCVVYCWLDRGLSRKAVRHLALKRLGLTRGTILVYMREWKQAQR